MMCRKVCFFRSKFLALKGGGLQKIYKTWKYEVEVARVKKINFSSLLKHSLYIKHDYDFDYLQMWILFTNLHYIKQILL